MVRRPSELGREVESCTYIAHWGKKLCARTSKPEKIMCPIITYHNYFNISDWKLHCGIISSCSEKSQSLWQSKNNSEVNTILNFEQICDMCHISPNNACNLVQILHIRERSTILHKSCALEK